MEHRDHLRLIRDGIPMPTAVGTGPVWADLGSGGGAFTLALVDALGGRGTVYSVDRDRGALRRQAQAMRSWFPDADVVYTAGDFTQPLHLPPLDGIVMANALHFVRRQEQIAVTTRLRQALKPDGRLILVEYDTDHGNHWVPYPLAFPSWEALARGAGFAVTRLLATYPSRFLGRIYSALSTVAAS
jgi:ubiquinone/menaquinone biosynthesis C-methylase UbiE